MRFQPETVNFVQWSERLCDAMLTGELTPFEAKRLLRHRARRLIGANTPLF